jgi:hypothetical protein
MNKTSLAIVALVVVAATTAIGFYSMLQNAQADSVSFSQSNRQHSHVTAGIIAHAGVGNQHNHQEFNCC